MRNYLEIVLEGFFNNNYRRFLDRHFLREFKKAEKENFEADEFFQGLFNVTEWWADEIFYNKDLSPSDSWRIKRDVGFYGQMRRLKAAGRLPEKELKMTGRKETELEDRFLGLFQLTADRPLHYGGQDYLFTLEEVLEIEDAISVAFQTVRSKNERSSAQERFSVLEWATIFYYALEAKQLDGNSAVVKNIKNFMTAHKIPTKTFKAFRSRYYDAKKRINKTNDYPIAKLEKIKPFLQTNYNQSVTLLENEILFLKEEQSDY